MNMTLNGSRLEALGGVSKLSTAWCLFRQSENRGGKWRYGELGLIYGPEEQYNWQSYLFEVEDGVLYPLEHPKHAVLNIRSRCWEWGVPRCSQSLLSNPYHAHKHSAVIGVGRFCPFFLPGSFLIFLKRHCWSNFFPGGTFSFCWNSSAGSCSYVASQARSALCSSALTVGRHAIIRCYWMTTCHSASRAAACCLSSVAAF